jgi:hypothetical protein
MRRGPWLLVLTHAVAFALPLVPGLAILHHLKPANANLTALLEESYSRQVAGFDVLVGDDRAAVAGLRRHLDRLVVVRRQSEMAGLKVDVLPDGECSTLAEIAFLAETGERDARVADASAGCHEACPKCRVMDTQHVLDVGARWLKLERGAE